MKTPYTDAPLDAFLIAQSCAGVVLSAVLWHKPVRSAAATIPLFSGIWLCVVAPIAASLVSALTGWSLPANGYLLILSSAALLGTLTAALSMRFWLLVFAVVGQAFLYRLSHWAINEEWDLAVVHLSWLGVIAAVGQADPTPPRTEPLAPHATTFSADDGLVAMIAFGLALALCVILLDRGCDSDDEWAYTWQAAVFAHGRAYLPSPPCGDSLRSYWIFFSEGRAFAQYTPGWPAFMTPFALFRVPWLAGPVAHGVLAVGVARLSRRVVGASQGGFYRASPRQTRAAGFIGALTATMGSAVLLNGASRYSHIFVALLFAWCVELTASLIFDPASRRDLLARAAILGLCAAWLLATRPTDGATLGTGIFFLFVYGVVRGRLRLPAIASTAAGFLALGGVTLLILRLQLGKWFTTGYSLTSSYYPWATPSFSVPQAYQLKYGLPLVTMAYGFWPASLPIGGAGLLRARGSARPVTIALAIGTAALLVMYVLSELGRTDFDFGYGNRFQLPCVVLLGVGAALLLSPLFSPTSHEHGGVGPSAAPVMRGPAALVVLAMLMGVVRISPLIWSTARGDILKYMRIERAIERQGVHDAIVVSSARDNGAQALDVPRTWPIPLPDVIIAGDSEGTETKCLKEHFPDRRFYRAVGFGSEVILDPL